jgi:hypothetical protein
MRKLFIIVAVATLSATGCSHTKSVTPPPQEDRSSHEDHRKRQSESDKHAAEHPRRHHETQAEPSSHAPAVPLATSPASLLQPGAAAALQDKLIGRGLLDQNDRSQELDGKTQKALRDFQRDQGLPATGTPDDLTVRKLGLDPARVFRSSKEEQK